MLIVNDELLGCHVPDGAVRPLLVVFSSPDCNHELRFLLASAYRRFYLRPTFFARYWTRAGGPLMGLARRLDAGVAHLHARKEAALMSRPVAC